MYTLLTTDEARILQLFFLMVFLCSEISKGVDDDTKDEVLEDDNDDQEEEGEVVEHSEKEQWLLQNESEHTPE